MVPELEIAITDTEITRAFSRGFIKFIHVEYFSIKQNHYRPTR